MTVTQRELAGRLRAAREACGLTQARVAQHLGVSRPTIAQAELGNRSVTSLELDRLAYLYGRDVRDLLADDFHAEEALLVLFRSDRGEAPEEPIFEALRRCLAIGRELTNLERLVGVDRSGAASAEYALPSPRTRWEAIQQGDRAATAERRRLGLGVGRLPNVAEMLETQGIRTAQVSLPENVSGLTLVAPEVGSLVVANVDHHYLRRRFSYAHEYCHVLLDRARRAAISRAEERDQVAEVRANAFAASFLMPGEGVHDFIEGLAKGRPGRLRAEVFDMREALRAEERPEPGSQAIQIYDVAVVAHHFGVSRKAALYRLKNLKLLNQSQFDVLLGQEQAGSGKTVETLLGLEELDHEAARREFRHRFLALAFEALRRGETTRAKLAELGHLVDVSRDDLEAALQAIGLNASEGEVPALSPEL
jgi:Zn-dependent peptidase ImmA (M78 family)/DNA-binding XRE family transcriptional regulator